MAEIKFKSLNFGGEDTYVPDLSEYAKAEDIPTKVSELENDAGYLTEHQDLSAYAKREDVPTKVSELDNDAGYISGYTETDPTVPAWAKADSKPSYTPSEIGLTTETWTFTLEDGSTVEKAVYVG